MPAENGEEPSFSNEEWPAWAFLFSFADPFHDLDLQNVLRKRALFECPVVESPQVEFGT